MAQSLVKNLLHIVFSTKNRQSFVTESVAADLYGYLAGVCTQLECHAMKIGGYKDHVHILCLLSKKITLINLLEKLKSSSSKWMKTKGDDFINFYWQDGYGAFSVNPSETGSLVNYIANQREHHRHQSFKEEYLAFLKEYKVEYDERYVWD